MKTNEVDYERDSELRKFIDRRWISLEPDLLGSCRHGIYYALNRRRAASIRYDGLPRQAAIVGESYLNLTHGYTLSHYMRLYGDHSREQYGRFFVIFWQLARSPHG